MDNGRRFKQKTLRQTLCLHLSNGQLPIHQYQYYSSTSEWGLHFIAHDILGLQPIQWFSRQSTVADEQAHQKRLGCF
jgi:hypothetical protein